MRATDHHNRAKIAAASTGDADLHSWQRDSFSVSKNVRTEQACAEPNYSELIRTVSTAESGTPPDGNTQGWDLKGYWGLHGYTSQTGSGSVDLELWAFDPVADEWFLVETKSSVADKTEFHFDGKVRGRQVFLRVPTFNGSVTAVTVRCSAE